VASACDSETHRRRCGVAGARQSRRDVLHQQWEEDAASLVFKIALISKKEGASVCVKLSSDLCLYQTRKNRWKIWTETG
jgi:hypothetical protein